MLYSSENLKRIRLTPNRVCVSSTAHWDEERALSSPGASSGDSGDSCHDNGPSERMETLIRAKQEMIKVEDVQMRDYPSSVLFSSMVCRGAPGPRIILSPDRLQDGTSPYDVNSHMHFQTSATHTHNGTSVIISNGS